MYQFRITYPDGRVEVRLMSGRTLGEETRARETYEAEGCTVEGFYGVWR
jgi:hypothetical protein